MQNAGKKLLVLDLDETLIYATEEELERKADFRAGQYLVYKRPFLGSVDILNESNNLNKQ
ncbi:MAG: hypothetical protein M3209_03335 [Acidobacteriota bacterium]|nr:hypothetical protein [Acidobacteriota bacterium]